MEKKPYDIWTSKSTYVDMDTGEVIKSNIAKDEEKYIKIKTIKKTNYNEQTARGHIEYTITVRRNPQQRIFV